MASFNLSPDELDAIAEKVADRLADKIAALIEESKRNDPLAKKYFSEREVAEMLGISLPFLKKRRLSGKVACSRPVKPIAYSREDIERLEADLMSGGVVSE